MTKIVFWKLSKKSLIIIFLLILAWVWYYVSQNYQSFVMNLYSKYQNIENQKFETNSKEIIKNFNDIPESIKNKVVLVWNPKSNIIIINTQWWPVNFLVTDEVAWILWEANISRKNVLLVDVHQCQTLQTKKFETKEISFEEAKECDKKSVEFLAKTVEYFKSKNKKVYVLWISFWAFIAQDLLANYPNIANKYIIEVWRLAMPKEVWKEFSKWNYVWFEYDKKWNKIIIPFNSEQAWMWWWNSIWDKNSSKLAAWLWYKRFIELLKDKNLENVVYVYGNRDEQVWRLSKKEIEFLKSKKVQVYEFDGSHSDAIDAFSEKFLKNIIFNN